MIANPNDGNTPKVEQAVPKISVSAAGLITATAEQQEGYVPGGTKSTTQQLTTQGAKTVTPGRTAQSAVASGYYTTGEVQVAGDSNLVAENIAEGVSIFGVMGTHSGSGELVTVELSVRRSTAFDYQGNAHTSTFSTPINTMVFFDSIDPVVDNLGNATRIAYNVFVVRGDSSFSN